MVKIPYPLSILIAAVIFFMCIIQMPDEMPPELQIPYLDKLVHFLMYLGLTGMLFIENFKRKNNYGWKDFWAFLFGKIKKTAVHPVSRKAILILSFLSLSYGGLIEIIQEYFSLHRAGDAADFYADAVGVLAAVCLLIIVQRNRINLYNVADK